MIAVILLALIASPTTKPTSQPASRPATASTRPVATRPVLTPAAAYRLRQIDRAIPKIRRNLLQLRRSQARAYETNPIEFQIESLKAERSTIVQGTWVPTQSPPKVARINHLTVGFEGRITPVGAEGEGDWYKAWCQPNLDGSCLRLDGQPRWCLPCLK